MSASSNNSNPAIVTELLKAGADSDLRKSRGRKAADYARRNDKFKQCLVEAVHKKNIEQVNELLRIGLSTDVRDDNGFTVLMNAIRAKWSDDEILALIRGSRRLNYCSKKDGKTALIYAIESGIDAKVIEDLLENGANVNRSNSAWRRYDLRESVTPLGCAAIGSSPEVIKALLLAGAKVNARMGRSRMTPLMKAARYAADPEPVRLLLLAGAKPDLRSRSGWTALVWAASQNRTEACVEIVKTLLKGRAKLGVQDRNGYTALMWAGSGNGNKEVAKVLLEAGAKTNPRARPPRGQSGFWPASR